MIASADDLKERELKVKVYTLVGTWMETFLYGIYLYLFVTAMRVLSQRQALRKSSSKVFFIGTVIMFISITLHNGLNIYRLVIGFGYASDAQDSARYFTELVQWENYAPVILFALILWTGDSLIIYRCFLVWQRNYWIIALPSLLFISTVGTHTVSLWSARHIRLNTPGALPQATLFPILCLQFPLYAIQNITTTSLIILRIWLTHRETQRAGVKALNTPSLVSVMRIIIESAAIFTSVIVIAAVLRMVMHPARLLFLYILSPSIGIAFVLLVIRVHCAGSDAKSMVASPSLLPSWLVAEPATCNSNVVQVSRDSV
ncbi:hypothetical protein BKA70DRAFT_1131066 [Coprinopsis sp. MPI-PUGE-AT-0042]|nr:hypothetical protein BKA70DRAFT_1131066 [Coprinopsis sp. MPI-PUGE-AT-0042]